MLTNATIRALERQIGPESVYTRPADLAAYAYDAHGASGERRLPDAVVFPSSTEDVSRVVQICAEAGVPVIPRGAGSGYSGGAVATEDGVILNLCRMDRILDIDATKMVLRAEAGTVTQHIQAAAEKIGLYYPPDPGSASTCTIGGNVATNASGPHALRYGATADFLAGATAVTADGRVHTIGNSGGLRALLPGSEGTLAVITEVSLRLLRAPETRITVGATFASMEDANRAVAEIDNAGVVPAALEYLDNSALEALRKTPLQHVPDAGAFCIFETEGDKALVTRETEAIQNAIAKANGKILAATQDPMEYQRLWSYRKSISAAVARLMIGKVNEDIVVPRDRISEAVAKSQAIAEKHEVPIVTFGHLGDGNLHITFLIDPRIAGERERGQRAAHDLFDWVLETGGSLSGEHGVGTTKLAYVEKQLGTETLDVMRRIKSHYDPRGILNPGIKIPDTAAATA